MLQAITYYYINDLKKIAKTENHIPFIYDKEKGWQVDNANILNDRLMGYDGQGIGSTDMLLRIDEISEEEAMKAIKAS